MLRRIAWLALALSLLPVAASARPLHRGLTPGVVRPMTAAEVCSIAWGTDRRFVTERMKQHVATVYGVAWKSRAKYEFDHLIPRSLGGADDVLNLWPEPLAEAKRLKDVLEVKLWKLVCAHELRLVDAQEWIRRDWRQAYQVFVGPLPPAALVGAPRLLITAKSEE
jgi:hypothetical protein